MNRTSTVIVSLIGIVVIAAGVWFVIFKNKAPETPVVVTPPVATSTAQTYASTTLGISLQYPQGYTVDENYAYGQFGPNKLIHGVSFTIPQAMATGTNLSSDTYVSVEQLPNAKNCTGDIFLQANVKPMDVTDGGIDYSVASSTDAAAGNRYEEWVYALVGSKPCTAVRYFIHYGVIDNYPPGTVNDFNRDALISDFDSIRHSLIVTPATTP